MEKLYAIKRPDGTIIIESITYTAKEAWFLAGDHKLTGHDLDHGMTDITAADVAEPLGYRCVEVEVVKAGGRVCEWTEDTEGTFVTSCGNYFQFTADGPKENKFQFCPYCGGKIVEAQGGKKEGGK